ncbi:SAM-dependent methyltransferase, putative [Geotalea daltonii FRC-32]|uniref:SAM-dependent methyltransferase, putative n=1 Tax=Geotalea daltonii (strain DSM 22248 / JCM 15807 / FRC-32) TaxID=316067 RepID=B9M0I1_GEODF|nr:FkbM family methyltransferase [Geotalea daltonii]ACM19018.1 SAM-dependent methyltransferase, putative [Geotalea daltonii FRC-32]
MTGKTMPSFLNSLKDIPAGARLCLYGVGEGCLHLLQKLQSTRPDVVVIALIDDARKNLTLTIPLVTLEEIDRLSCDLILVTSVYWIDICQKLKTAGCTEFVVAAPDLLFEHLIFDDSELKLWARQIAQTSALLSDAQQKALYNLVVTSRTRQPEYQQRLHDYFHAHRSSMGREYLEFINSGDLQTIIEGGVFDGADTREFARCLCPGGTVHGFDPNLATPSPLSSSQISLYPMALWSSRTFLPFFSNRDNPPGARIVTDMAEQDEVQQVPAISIDEFTTEQALERVDLIKLDVEGAEAEVLQGAIATLKRHRPQLAVCIYHKKQHLFQVPLLLNSMLHGYHYYLGHYSPTFWDTVWYAVPEEKDYRHHGRK